MAAGAGGFILFVAILFVFAYRRHRSKLMELELQVSSFAMNDSFQASREQLIQRVHWYKWLPV